MKPYSLLEAVIFQAMRSDEEDDEDEETNQESVWMVFNRQFLNDSNGFQSNSCLYKLQSCLNLRNYKIHWRIVISYVDLALKLYPHDSQILRTAAYAFLKYSIKIPIWLETRYKVSLSQDIYK